MFSRFEKYIPALSESVVGFMSIFMHCGVYASIKTMFQLECERGREPHFFTISTLSRVIFKLFHDYFKFLFVTLRGYIFIWR